MNAGWSVCAEMRSALVLWCLIVCVGLSESHDREERLVRISQGPVRGYKEAADDFFGFYGIPYATAPTGKHRFKVGLISDNIMTFLNTNKDKHECRIE